MLSSARSLHQQHGDVVLDESGIHQRLEVGRLLAHNAQLKRAAALEHSYTDSHLEVIAIHEGVEEAYAQQEDADLIGIPLRVTIGGKGLAEGIAEIKWRTEGEVKKIPLADAVAVVKNLIAEKQGA